MSATETQRQAPPATVPASRAVARKTLIDRLNSPAQLAEIQRVLPKHLTATRMARVAATAISKTPELANCTPESFFLCLLRCSEMGLEPDGRRAHLIPFKNKSKQITECQLIVDYKGLAELAMRSGLISYLHADVVRDKDDFDWDLGRIVKHKVNFREPRGEAYAAYAIAHTKDGGVFCEVMSAPEIIDVRDGSQGWQAFQKGYTKSSPWDPANEGSEKEMWKKTAFRRLAKWLPLSPEIRDALEVNDLDTQTPEKVKLNSEFLSYGEGEQAPAIEAITTVRQPKSEEPTQAAATASPAPVAPAPKPEPPASPAVTTDTLAEFLEKNGVPFDAFRGWLVQIGVLSSVEECASVDELPQTTISLLTTKDLRKCALLHGKTPEGLV